LRNISCEALTEDGRDIATIRAVAGENINGIYGLLSSIADSMQLDGLELSFAADLAVGRYREILAQRLALTEPAEIGLVGELTFLNYLMKQIGPEEALASWLGPRSEEHDFVLPTIHIEVKTTTSERRRHVVSGLAQLAPLPHIQLAVLSIQLTRATPDTGRTLPSIILDLRVAAGKNVLELDGKLERLGWNPEDHDLYRSYWVLRSTPSAYLVDDSFPAITADRIRASIPNLALVDNVSYEVDLSELSPTVLPAPYGAFCSTREA